VRGKVAEAKSEIRSKHGLIACKRAGVGWEWEGGDEIEEGRRRRMDGSTSKSGRSEITLRRVRRRKERRLTSLSSPSPRRPSTAELSLLMEWRESRQVAQENRVDLRVDSTASEESAGDRLHICRGDSADDQQ
jgi:hypothetical protein